MRTGTGAGMVPEARSDLVEGLRQLETYLPRLGAASERDDLEAEIEELEELIAAAGEADDQQSTLALAFLQTELARKRARLDDR